MKKQILLLTAGLSLCTYTLNAQHHDQTQSSKTETEVSYNAPAAFQDQMQNVYKASIDMKNAFVATDPSRAKEMAKQVKLNLGKIDMMLLSGDAHVAWMSDLKILNASLERIIISENISEQREAFATFNEALYKSLKAFGMNGETAFYQFCPMANDHKGAYWLSELQEIQNPYFGSKMLSCGSTVDSLDNN